MPQRLNKLHLIICAAAAAVVAAACILRGETLYHMSLWVSGTIVGFYILGHFVRFFLVNRVFPEPTEVEEPSESGDDDAAALNADPLRPTDDLS